MVEVGVQVVHEVEVVKVPAVDVVEVVVEVVMVPAVDVVEVVEQRLRRRTNAQIHREKVRSLEDHAYLLSQVLENPQWKILRQQVRCILSCWNSLHLQLQRLN